MSNTTSFLDDLRIARNESAIAYHLFLLKYPRPGIYTFFEGEGDSSFYANPIRGFNSHNLPLFQFDCNGKEDVLNTYRKIDEKSSHFSETSQTRILFFVDKDYDDLLGKNAFEAFNIFVTKFYSVENYIVSESMLQVVMEDLFNFNNTHFDFEIIQNKFLTELDKFYELILPITAWIIYLKKSEKRINLKDIKLTNFLKFGEDISLDYVDTELSIILEKISLSLGVEPEPNAITYCKDIIIELQQHDPKQITRGKFELWFFVSFIKLLAASLKREVLADHQNLKTHLDIGVGNALHILGPRAVIPEELKEFLKSNLS